MQTSLVSHTSSPASPPSSLLPPSFLSVSLSSTSNVRHFDTEHPISHGLADWLYMQMASQFASTQRSTSSTRCSADNGAAAIHPPPPVLSVPSRDIG